MAKMCINRSLFEKLLCDNVGNFSAIENGNTLQYIEDIDTSIPRQLCFTDEGIDGIRLSYYDHQNEKMWDFRHIYRWSDAFWLMLFCIERPDLVRFDDVEKDILPFNQLMKRDVYDFTWEPEYGLIPVDNAVLENAIELVKHGLIDHVIYGEVKDCVSVYSKVGLCKKETITDLISNLRTLQSLSNDIQPSRRINWVKTSAVTLQCTNARCERICCLYALCGYIEYLYTCGKLQSVLELRKKTLDVYSTPCGPYNFTWIPENGLRYLEESQYQLALQLADKHMVKVDKDLFDYYRLKIYPKSGPCALGNESCDKEISATDISRFTASCDNSVSWSNIYAHKFISENLAANFAHLDSCKSCHMKHECILFCAGYIRYLKDCGLEECIDADRMWYHDNERLVEEKRNEDQKGNPPMFDFALSNELFLDEPEELFEIANLLQQQNCVSLYCKTQFDEKDKTNKVLITTFKDVVPPCDLSVVQQKINDRTINRIELSAFLWKIAGFGNVYHGDKYIIVAAYLDYLKRTNQYWFYREHLKKWRRDSDEKFNQLRSQIPELDYVAGVAENKRESSLYCVIEGERGTQKENVVKRIAKRLAQAGKITSDSYECMTFERLASKVSHKQYELLETGQKAYDYNVFKNFEPQKLYVLTDLREFLEESKQAKDGDGSRASHLVKLLGRYQPNTYIIVISEKLYSERFLSLSANIQFLFGNNVIRLESPKPEDIYKQFCTYLDNDLSHDVTENSAFHDEFVKYIIMNRKLLPLTSQELAAYLAEYANSKKQLLLPPVNKLPAKELLNSVIGMKNVKKTIEEFEKYALFVKRAEMNGMHLPHSNMHMIFTGNPGTGKTMVARIIAQILFDFGIIQENKLCEVERKDLVGGYIGQTAIKTGEMIEKALNGVLFVDEAYTLASGDSYGSEAVATLIKAMEDHKDKLVVIFAGYEKEMHDFLEINPGIASRVGYTFHFDDYTADELTDIFDAKMKKAGFEYEADVLSLVMDLCSEFTKKRNFGNGRFVDKIIQKTLLKHASKGGNIRFISAKDIPSAAEMASTAVVEHKNFEDQLANFIGMENVKVKIRQFAQYVQFQQAAKASGAKIPSGNMHMIFTGNPGTGKTTIARIMVDMLHDIGVLKEHKLKEVERKDLVSKYAGETASKTAKVIDEAMGGILFVDEAYALANDSLGAEAIATLIKAMEDHKDDLIVIFAGYKDEMRQFLNTNPGISSRIGYTFHFDNYSPNELGEMFKLKLHKSNFQISERALGKAKILFEYFSKKKHFGNGRFVDKLQQETFMQHSQNIMPDQSNLLYIDEADIPEISDINNTARPDEKSNGLDSIVGMQSVKEQVKDFERLVNFQIIAREHGLTVPSTNMHMVFTGNPGTGKTTIARIVAKKLYDIGVIKENKLTEVDRKDLVAEYLGQTATKTAKVIESALGGVLFVDEAYSLVQKYVTSNDYGHEAVATLIKAMEDHKDDLVVIFAGYKDEMSEFIKTNPGIASRIGSYIHFPDYTVGELREIFIKKLEGNGFTITPQAQEKVEKLMQYFCSVKNFGNGRFVDNVMQKTLSLHAKNYRIDAMGVIDEADIPEITDIAKTVNGATSVIDPKQLTLGEKRRLAIHEVGHALLQLKLFPTSDITKITIDPEGNGVLGYVRYTSSNGVTKTKSFYQNKITVLMAGLAAETVFLGDYSDSGTSDIRKASDCAQRMITKYGMSQYGFVSDGYSTTEINELLNSGFVTASRIVQNYKDALQEAIEYLLQHGTISVAAFKNCLDSHTQSAFDN